MFGSSKGSSKGEGNEGNTVAIPKTISLSVLQWQLIASGRDGGSLGGLPLAGMVATVDITQQNGRHTATRLAAGAALGGVGGLLVAGSKKQRGHIIQLTLTAADGRVVTRTKTGGSVDQKAAMKLAGRITSLGASLAASQEKA